MLTIEFRILSYFEHVVKALFKNFFGNMLLESYLIAYHQNIGV
jgi:hypothetical protein